MKIIIFIILMCLLIGGIAYVYLTAPDDMDDDEIMEADEDPFWW